MTATLAAILIENGKLHWSSTIKELLPQMTLHPAFASMRFETLLVHRTGFPVEHSVINDVRSMSATEGRRIIAQKILTTAPLSFPDSEFTYSNYNYIIAGYILETILKTSWEELMKKHIFNPLEMNSCGFGATSTLVEENPSQPWGHYKKNGEITPLHFDNPLSFGPSSSVHCSIEDWSKFLIVHLKGFNGENNIVTAGSYKKLHSPHPSGDSNYTYGGWHLLTREWARGPTLSHAGSNTFNYAKVWIAPKRNSFVVSTANIGGEDAFLATDAIIKEFIQDFL
jgi:CubicO group peptidase (beta-lactamase class C family)